MIMMAEDLATLQAQLVALNTARARGVSVISYTANGATRSTTYKSDSEMQAAQDDLLRRIAALQNSNASRTIKISASKGLHNHEER
jgi:hypothetical protein